MTRLEDDENALEAMESFSEHASDTWPVWEAVDGTLYALAGVWSSGQREYEYQHLEVAGEDVRLSPWASEVGVWKGNDAGEAYRGCHPKYDGPGYHQSGKYSVVALYRITAGAPVWAKHGATYRSSGGNFSGTKRSDYYGCGQQAETYHGYLRATRAFRARCSQPDVAAALDEQVGAN